MTAHTFVDGLNRGLFTRHARAVRARRGFPIHAYVGPNGAGKSLLCAADTEPTLRGIMWSCDNPDHGHTREGRTTGLRRVLSTMRFTSPDGSDHPLWVPLVDFAQILTAEHVDLVLDEVAGAAGSSTSDDLPGAVKASLQELRRRDVLCRWTAPSWARASKVLRECTQGVTLTLGFLPVAHTDGVGFDGPHDVEVVRYVDPLGVAASGKRARRVVVEVDRCLVEGQHSHDSGRLWGARRLMLARTFDSNVFDEWTVGKREKLKPEVRQLLWRPGSTAETAYDTHAAVEKLGQITDAGVCLDCGGNRRRRSCDCEDDRAARRASRLARASSRSAAAVPVVDSLHVEGCSTSEGARLAEETSNDGPAAA